MTISGLTITRYERQNQRDVLDLVYRQFYVHTHLDWYGVEGWLAAQSTPILLAWSDGRLQGVMGVSSPLNGTCWLRLLAVREHAPIPSTLKALWDIMRETLKPLGVRSLWILLGADWLARYAAVFNAEQVEMIVTLRRVGTALPELRNTQVTTRPAEDEDIGEITRVDHMAFAPPWQLSAQDIRQAFRIAASATVAELNGRIVGYQFSTRHRDSGHLARLAVEPYLQGGGVGGALLHRLLPAFADRGIQYVTVNTQSSNERSQRLYNYYHFTRNGYDMPVWSARIMG